MSSYSDALKIHTIVLFTCSLLFDTVTLVFILFILFPQFTSNFLYMYVIYFYINSTNLDIPIVFKYIKDVNTKYVKNKRKSVALIKR